MDRKGAGYAHEILMGVFFLLLVMMFFAKGDTNAIMPPMMLMLGIAMILGGFVTREPMIVAGGFAVLAIALMYSEVFPR